MKLQKTLLKEIAKIDNTVNPEYKYGVYYNNMGRYSLSVKRLDIYKYEICFCTYINNNFGRQSTWGNKNLKEAIRLLKIIGEEINKIREEE